MFGYARRFAGFLWFVFFLTSPPAVAAQVEHPSDADPLMHPRTDAIIRPETTRPAGFDWQRAVRDSLCFLGIEHGLRMAQVKTQRQLSGPFFKDWSESVHNLHGWGDGDPPFTNYVAHPLQGGVAGFIQIQNDPAGKYLEFSSSKQYWHSRMRAFAWSALYSTQFEIGPISEATLGNVGMKRGTAGYVDLVITPVGGMGMIVLEDAIDKYWLKNLEQRTSSPALRRFYRMAFNPERSLANLIGGHVPWYRTTRPL